MPRARAAPRHLSPPQIEQIGPALGAEKHDTFEGRDVGSHSVDHRDVVARFVAGRREEQPAFRLAKRVLDLVGAVSRIEVHEDRTRSRRGVLNDHPFSVVRAPDADPIPRGNAGAEETQREPVDRGIEIGVSQADSLERYDQGIALRKSTGSVAQVFANRLSDERNRGRPVRVRKHNGVQYRTVSDRRLLDRRRTAPRGPRGLNEC